LRRLQKQDDDEDKSRTAAGREFRAAGPQTAKLWNRDGNCGDTGITKVTVYHGATILRKKP